MLNKNKTLSLFFLSLAILVSVFVFENSHASSVDCDTLTTQTEKDTCEKQKKALEKQAKTYQSLIKIKAKQADTIQSQLSLIDSEQKRNQNELEDTHDKLQTLSEQIDDLKKNITENETEIKYKTTVLSGLLQSYYENDQQGILSLVMMDKDVSELFKQLDYTQQTSTKVTELLDEIKKTKEDLETDKDDLQTKKKESEQTKEDLQTRNLNLQSTENKKQTLLSQTQEEKEKYEKLLEEVDQEIDGLEESMFSGVDLSNLPPIKKGYFTYPVNPVVITQGYGKTSFSSHYTSGKHNGVDFSVKYKSVYAAKSGKVTATGNNGRYAYGNWVAINHGDGLTTLYGHFSKISVSKGDSVKEGETIGTSGNTGFSTGPHLHFSVFSSKTFEVVESTKVKGLMLPVGASVNPKNYL